VRRVRRLSAATGCEEARRALQMTYPVHELRRFLRSLGVAAEIVLPARAAIYCRVAAPAADLPISHQEQACRERAAELGWTVQEVFVDRSGSAFRPSRPGVAALRGRAACPGPAIDRLPRAAPDDSQDPRLRGKGPDAFRGYRYVTNTRSRE
jgi:hypothetical protein